MGPAVAGPVLYTGKKSQPPSRPARLQQGPTPTTALLFLLLLLGGHLAFAAGPQPAIQSLRTWVCTTEDVRGARVLQASLAEAAAAAPELGIRPHLQVLLPTELLVGDGARPTDSENGRVETLDAALAKAQLHRLGAEVLPHPEDEGALSSGTAQCRVAAAACAAATPTGVLCVHPISMLLVSNRTREGDSHDGIFVTTAADYAAAEQLRQRRHRTVDSSAERVLALEFRSDGPLPWALHKLGSPSWPWLVPMQAVAHWLQLERRVLQTQLGSLADPVHALWYPVYRNSVRFSAAGSAALPAVAALADTARTSPAPKINIVVGTFSPSRLPWLETTIRHYLACACVDRIFIVWHNAATIAEQHALSLTISAAGISSRVVFLTQDTDSLNNRFNILQDVPHGPVAVTDDDIRVSHTDLARALAAWQQQPLVLVGLFPRSHETHGTDSPRFRYRFVEHDASMVLTKFMVFAAEYLAVYSALTLPQVGGVVDNVNNCEDIAFNMVVSGLSGLAPIVVEGDPLDLGEDSTDGLSSRPDHYRERSRCLDELAVILGGNPLLKTESMTVPIRPWPRCSTDEQAWTDRLEEHATQADNPRRDEL